MRYMPKLTNIAELTTALLMVMEWFFTEVHWLLSHIISQRISISCCCCRWTFWTPVKILSGQLKFITEMSELLPVCKLSFSSCWTLLLLLWTVHIIKWINTGFFSRGFFYWRILYMQCHVVTCKMWSRTAGPTMMLTLTLYPNPSNHNTSPTVPPQPIFCLVLTWKGVR